MAGNVSLINGHTDPVEKADCSKCIKECQYKEWFEHEMRVQEYGCSSFKGRSETE